MIAADSSPSREQTAARGWAVASISDDRIFVSTASEHRRAAIVNGLVSCCGIMVTRDWDDRRISSTFDNLRGGKVRLVEVEISVFERDVREGAAA